MRTLRDVERAARGGDGEALELIRRAAMHPVSRPASAAVAAWPLAPGETWLVGIQAARGEIWRLVADDRPARGRVPLVREAHAAAELATWLVSRDVPAFAPPQRRRVWEATPVSPTQMSSVLDGSSYGLALFLAAASRALTRSVPDDLVALGVLGMRGEVAPVDAFQEKLAVLRGWAPGLRRLLVAPTQLAEARRRLLPDVEVLAVGSVAEALEIVWPAVDETLAARWRESPRDRDRMANVLFRAALQGETTFGWAGVARATDTLRKLADTDLLRWRLEIAHEIARRHECNQGLLQWPTDELLESLSRPLRLTLLAHVVQAQLDAGSDEVAATLARAERHLAPPRERHAEDLKLLGAMGRLAGIVDMERACHLLEQAVDGWRSIDRLEEASHALCEALRVGSLLGRDVGALREVAAELLEMPRLPGSTPAFVRCALGVAAVLRGELDVAHEVMSDASYDWHRAERHLQARRRRWLARVHRARGEAPLAASLVADLASLDSASALLAALEQLDDERAAEELISRLRAEPSASGLVRRLETHPQRREPLARWIVDAYPY